LPNFSVGMLKTCRPAAIPLAQTVWTGCDAVVIGSFNQEAGPSCGFQR
jgi:hypothetical protein